MSRENVEVVRGLAEAWQGGDLDAAYAVFDPAIEWDATRMEKLVPDLADVFHGHEGVRAFWRRWLSAWKDLQFDVQEILGAGNDVVLLIHSQRQWGRHSGIATELPPYAHVYTFRSGKVVQWRCYPDHESALEAVGLSEQAMSRENVELVRQAYDEFNETGALPEDLVHPDAEFDASRVLPDLGVIRGLPAYTAALQDYWSSYDDFKAEVEEVVDAEDRLVVSIRDSGRPTGSPNLVTNRNFHVVTLRDGKLLRLDIYLDKAEALEAAGLSKQAMSRENVELVRSIYAAWESGDFTLALGRQRVPPAAYSLPDCAPVR